MANWYYPEEENAWSAPADIGGGFGAIADQIQSYQLPAPSWDNTYYDTGNAFNQIAQGVQDYQQPAPNWDSWQGDNQIGNAFGQIGNNIYDHIDQQNYYNPYQDIGASFGFMGNQADFSQAPSQPRNIYDQLDYYQDPTSRGGLLSAIGRGVQNLPPPTPSGEDFSNWTFTGEGAPGDQRARPKEWYQSAWEGFNAVPQVALNAMGALFTPVGQAVDLAADSGIPVLSQGADILRTGYEQIAEPVFNATPSLIGTLAGSVDTNNSFNPLDWQFNRNYAAQGWEANDPDKVYQETYASLKAQGKSDEEAQKRAERERAKMLNPINRAFSQGAENFQTLPAAAQLGVNLFDPVANKFGEAIFNPVINTGVKGAGKLADVTGVTKLTDKATELLESPQQREYLANKVIDEQLMPQAQQIATELEMTPAQVLDEMVNNPASEIYYEKLGIGDPNKPNITQGAIDEIRNALDEARTQAEGGILNIQRENLEGSKVYATDAEQLAKYDEFGQPQKLVQDDLNRLSTDLERKFDLQPDEAMNIAKESLNNPAYVESLVDTPYNKTVEFLRTQLDNYKALDEFDNYFQQPATARAAALDQPAKIRPDYLNAVKAVNYDKADFADFAKAAKEGVGLRYGALKLDKTPMQQGKPPTFRRAKQLEQWGVVGAALRGMGVPISYLANTTLNSVSRAVRDPASNLVKMTLEGYSPFGQSKIAQKFDTVFGKEGTAHIGGGGVSKDITPTKEGKLAKGLYIATNLPNEALQFAVRKITKDKEFTFNKLADEVLQPKFERAIFRTQAVKAFDASIEALAAQGAPQRVADAFKQAYGRDITPNDYKAFLSGKLDAPQMQRVFSGEYAPLDYSPKLLAEKDKLATTRFSEALDLLTSDEALQGLLDKYNAERQQAYTGGLDSTKKAKKAGTSAPSKYQPDTLADLSPNHPVIRELETQVNSLMDVIAEGIIGKEEQQLRTAKADPQIEQLVNNYVAAKSVEHLQRTLDLKSKQRDAAGQGMDLYDKLAAEREAAQAKLETQQKQQELNRQLNDPAFRAFEKNYKKKYPTATRDQALNRFKQIEETRVNTAIGETGIEAGDVVKMPVSSIKFDPQRFQYKQIQTSGKGEVGSLQGVQKFDKTKAGVIQVWKDPANGNTYVINGHNRLALADRLGEKNINAMVIDAATPEEARAIGAITNISEGRGNAIDAAKFIKDSGLSLDQLKSQGVPLREKIAQDGLALSNLAPEIFQKVATYQMPLDRGITIGQKLPDPAQQRRLMKLLDKYEQKGKPLNQGIVNELADQIKAANVPAEMGQQLGLFGVEQFEKSYDLERAGLADYVRTKLSSDKKLFGAAAKGAESLKQVGDIDAARAAGISEEAARLQQLFDAYKNTPGSVSDILNNYSKQIADNPKQANALKQAAYAELQQALPEQIKTRAEQPDQPQASLFDDSQYKEPELIDAGKPEQPKTDTANQNQNKIEQKDGTQKNQPVQLSPEKLKFFADNIYNAPNVQTPQTLKKLADRYSRADAAQRRQYIYDMLDTDKHIREVTGNTYKLDPATLEPINIQTGKHLAEELGQQKPQPINPDYKPPLKYEGDLGDIINQIKEKYFDENGDPLADKSFLDMNPAEKELIMSEISYAVLGVDPTNVARATQEISAQLQQARTYIGQLKSDMAERYTQKQQGQKAAVNANANAKEAMRILQREAVAAQAKARVSALQQAEKARKNIYFDYNNKNLVDQALNSIVPFNFWARQNFSYLARHFASHPMHFAAVLNFYKELEEENKDLPPYARGNIALWTNPDGSKMLWNFNSVLPINPLGDSDSIMQLVSPDDPEASKTKNKTDLGTLLWGQDRLNSKGEFIGRDKGILPTFFRPNPVIDIASKTGVISDMYKALGWTTDNFGSPGVSEKQTLGLIPDRLFLRDTASALGVTQKLRELGLPIADLDIEAPLNEFFFGKNAGKPLTKVQQELTSMAQSGEVTPEQAKQALADLKRGNWTKVALQALDRTEGEDASRRLASVLGFTSLVVNAPREQLAAKIGQDYGAVKGNKEATKQFFADNKGASVAFSANKSPDEIEQGLKDDQTYQQVSAILKNKGLNQQQKEAALAKLQGANPAYFEKNPVTVYPDKKRPTTKTSTTSKQPYTPKATSSTTAKKPFVSYSATAKKPYTPYTPAKKPYTPAPKKSYQPAAKGKTTSPKPNQNIYTKLGLDFTRKPYTPKPKPSYTKTLPKPKTPARTAYTKPTPQSSNQFRKPLAVSYNSRYNVGRQDNVMSRLKSTALGRNMTLPPPVFTIKKKKTR